MYRMTPFTVGDISRSKVARRKGNQVRLFDPLTARMSGWMKGTRLTPPVKRAVLEGFTVAILRDRVAAKMGGNPPTKWRKADLVNYLLVA